MKKNIYFLSLAAFLVLVCPLRTEAQFFKKIFGKKEPERRSAPRQNLVAKASSPKRGATPKAARRTQAEQLELPPTIMKVRYRVDVFSAIYLNELVKGGKSVYQVRIPEKAMAGLNFYEGIKLATDSLNRGGYSMDVYMHDITDPLSSVATLINTGSLDSSDLLIGAVSTQQVGPLAAFALKHHINFISALSPSDDGVKGNPFFTLLQPTLQTHCEALRRAVGRKYPRQKVLVYHRSTGVDETAFRSVIKDNLYTYTPIAANTLPTAEQLSAEIDTTATNIVVMPIVDASYAAQALQSLTKAFPGARFEVYGMPSWKGMEVLKKGVAAPNMAVYLTAPFYFDPSTANGQMIASAYKRTYGSRPGEMVYRAYETLTWYAYLLNHYGTVFNARTGDNGAAAFTRFDVKPRWDAADNLLYNENTHLYLYRYEGGNYSVEQ